MDMLLNKKATVRIAPDPQGRKGWEITVTYPPCNCPVQPKDLTLFVTASEMPVVSLSPTGTLMLSYREDA